MTNDQAPEPSTTAASRRWLPILLVVAVIVVIAGIWWAVVALGSSTATEPTSGSSAATSTTTPSESTTDPTSTVPPTPTGTPSQAPDGSIVDEFGRTTAAPVPLDDVVAPSEDLSVSVAKMEAVQGESTIPGEVAGPALRVTVNFVNTGSEAVDTSAAIVNLYYGADMTPAGPLLKPGGSNVSPSVAPGETATGVYVFTVPADQRDAVTVEVDSAFDNPVTLFRGSVG